MILLLVMTMLSSLSCRQRASSSLQGEKATKRLALYIDYNDRSNQFGPQVEFLLQLIQDKKSGFGISDEDILQLSQEEVSLTNIVDSIESLAAKYADAPVHIALVVSSHGLRGRLCHSRLGEIDYADLAKALNHRAEETQSFTDVILDLYLDSCFSETARSGFLEKLSSDDLRANLYFGSSVETNYSIFWQTLKTIIEIDENLDETLFDGSLTPAGEKIFCAFPHKDRRMLNRRNFHTNNQHGVASNYRQADCRFDDSSQFLQTAIELVNAGAPVGMIHSGLHHLWTTSRYVRRNTALNLEQLKELARASAERGKGFLRAVKDLVLLNADNESDQRELKYLLD